MIYTETAIAEALESESRRRFLTIPEKYREDFIRRVNRPRQRNGMSIAFDHYLNYLMLKGEMTSEEYNEYNAAYAAYKEDWTEDK